ncbi:MAG: hypothetical protein ACOY0R_04790, partial [Chloroflexota bacterium]
KTLAQKVGKVHYLLSVKKLIQHGREVFGDVLAPGIAFCVEGTLGDGRAVLLHLRQAVFGAATPKSSFQV